MSRQCPRCKSTNPDTCWPVAFRGAVTIYCDDEWHNVRASYRRAEDSDE